MERMLLLSKFSYRKEDKMLLWSGSDKCSKRFCTGPLPVTAAWM
uniref:Uncharacterized protein n=1 Tax=Arundo donax TaxID=35708 RepID=A0A0A9GUD1_ARUDO